MSLRSWFGSSIQVVPDHKTDAIDKNDSVSKLDRVCLTSRTGSLLVVETNASAPPASSPSTIPASPISHHAGWREGRLQRSRAIACCGLLTAGFVLGASVDWMRRGASASDQYLTANTLVQLRQELKSSVSPLKTQSDYQAKVFEACSRSVVHIQSERFAGARRGVVEETGSGIIVESKKSAGFFVVTNRHVVDGTELNKVSIHLHDGRILTASRSWTDKASDIAVLRLDEGNLQPARWGDSDTLQIGHIVFAVGSPFGLSQSMTQGIISAKGRRALELGPGTEVINQDFLQTDAAINPGNSGGPLINLQGEVIGINTAIASSSGGNEGIGFSIPSNLVRQVCDQLLEYGKVNRAYLGVKLDPEFDLNTAKRLRLDRLRGARVLQVYPNTPAARANLLFDDVVLEFNGTTVLDENHLIHLVSLQPVNSEVQAIVQRNGAKVTIKFKLTERPDVRQSLNNRNKPGTGVEIEKLGLTLHELDTHEAAELGFPKMTSGLLVINVDEESPLQGKVQVYDLIEEVALTPMHTIDDLHDLLKDRESMNTLSLKVQRSVRGRPQTQLVIVGDQPLPAAIRRMPE
jgi:serine protease Do